MLSGLLLSAVLAVPGANPAPQAAQAPQHLPTVVGSTLPTVPSPTTQAPGFATVETLPALPPEEVLFAGQEPTVPGSLNDSHLGHPDRFWGGVHYLHYWFKDAPSPQGLMGAFVCFPRLTSLVNNGSKKRILKPAARAGGRTVPSHNLSCTACHSYLGTQLQVKAYHHTPNKLDSDPCT